MNKHIATAVALVVVLGIFFQGSFNESSGQSLSEKFAAFPLSFSLSDRDLDFSLPTLGNVSVATLAWATLEDYIEAAKNHDLEKIIELSHQISPTCSDPVKIEECNQLMDGIYGLTKDWKQSDFTEIAYDEKQIVLETNFKKTGEADPTNAALIFTRGSSGNPKLLSLKYCFGEEALTAGRCVNSDPETRDTNNNGWWDEVESLFR